MFEPIRNHYRFPICSLNQILQSIQLLIMYLNLISIIGIHCTICQNYEKVI